MPYNPELHTTVNKPLGMAQAGPTDARSKYFDEILGEFRPYNNTAEVLAYLNEPRFRDGQFPIVIRNGVINDEYWFRNGLLDADLVLKNSGIASETVAGAVQLATDAEMKLTAAVPEDAKVASRLKIFNWWGWIRQQVQVITGFWEFGVIKLNTTANAAPLAGHLWYDNVNYKVRKTASESIISTASNTEYTGTRERLVSANTLGGMQAYLEMEEEIVADQRIIDACTAAVFNAGNQFKADISAALPIGVTFFKGQKCKNATHYFVAFEDNTPVRITLG